MQVTMEEIVKMQPKGWLTIPAKFRRDLNLTNGLLKIKKIGTRLLIEPVRILPYSVRSYIDTEVEEFLEEDRKESRELRKKGLIK